MPVIYKGMEKLVNLLEDSYRPLAKAPIQNGCEVQGVKVLGIRSRNGREYPLDVIRKAAPLYEGVKVNLDHPKPNQIDRTYNERFGRLKNVRVKGDGLYADLVFNPHHHMAESFRWWATNDPNAVGLSHNASARIADGYGVAPDRVIEIQKVSSVDLVADPATTTGLMESLKLVQEGAPMADQNIDEELEGGADLPPAGDMGAPPPDLGGADLDMGGDLDMPPGGDMPPGAAPAGPEAVAGILNDPAMSPEEKLAAIAEALGLPAPAMGGAPGDDLGGMPEPDGDEQEMAMKAEEALRATNDPYYHALLESLDRYRVRESRTKAIREARVAAHAAKLPAYAITESFIDHLASTNKAGWKRIIQDQQKVAVRESRPISTGPVNQSSLSALKKFLTEN